MQPGFLGAAFFIGLIIAIVVTVNLSFAGFGYILGNKISNVQRVVLILGSILLVKPGTSSFAGIFITVLAYTIIAIHFKKEEASVLS